MILKPFPYYKSCKIIFLLVVLFFISCKKDNNTNPENTITSSQAGSMIISIEHYFDSLNFVFNNQYILDNGNKISISNYKYYISNIVLSAEDGSVFREEESYHLINAAQLNTCSFSIAKVPLKKYTAITFIIGVDSTRNVSGAQSGALDPALGMFWTWNTGYIMAKLEGVSQQSTAAGNSVAFHIGGFNGSFNALKQVTIPFNGQSALVSSTVSPILFLKNNIKEWFVNPITIDLSTTNNITMVNGTSKSIADNYSDMFSFKSISN